MPAGPVLTIAEMLAHPQVRARDMVVETQHPDGGRHAGDRLSDQVLGDARFSVARPAPMFGQHTREVLLEFGFDAAEIQALLDAGAASTAGSTTA